VFERDRITRSAILTVNPDGSDARRLTTGPHFDTGPAYAPRGARIVFGSDRGDDLADLEVVRTDGTHLHRLVPMRFAEGFPDWQPIAG
jgi:Tol biopolymer transport system component